MPTHVQNKVVEVDVVVDDMNFVPDGSCYDPKWVYRVIPEKYVLL